MFYKSLLISSLSTLVFTSANAAPNFTRILKDSACGPNASYVTPNEARINNAELCSKLGTWDIIRLANGGSMDGPGYGCKVRDFDDRHLGGSYCKSNPSFFAISGDAKGNEKICNSSGGILSSYLEFNAHKDEACGALGTWYIARVQGGGTVDGSGYECRSRTLDSRGTGHSLCASYDYNVVNTDNSCAPGFRLATPDEARQFNAEACRKLGAWDIIRLAGGGSIDGPGYGCGVRNNDTRGLGGSLCVPAKK